MTTDTVMPPPASRNRGDARQICLLGGPKSHQASTLVDHIVDHHVLPCRLAALPIHAGSPRPSTVQRFRIAAGALLADLLELQAMHKRDTTPPVGMHGLSPGHFSLALNGFARDVFLELMRHLETSGLLKIIKGKTRWHPAFGTYVAVGGDLTTFQLTPEALALAVRFGAGADAWAKHWTLKRDQRTLKSPSDQLLVLRSEATRIGNKKIGPADLPISYDDPRVQTIVDGISALNAHLQLHDFGGMAFTGLRRIFSNGGLPTYAWDQGGRYYSRQGGHHYETRGSAWRRSVITINGEAVDEVDLRASHLTLLHALLDKPFDPEEDPYGALGWPRAIVKLWVTQALGASNPRPTQWSREAHRGFEKERPGQSLQDEFPIRAVGAAITARHPALLDLKVCGITTHNLMFHEAEILRLAMENLMLRQGIPVLPVHDALIAPKSAVGLARATLQQAFATHVENVVGHPSKNVPNVTCKGDDDQATPSVSSGVVSHRQLEGVL